MVASSMSRENASADAAEESHDQKSRQRVAAIVRVGWRATSTPLRALMPAANKSTFGKLGKVILGLSPE